MKALLSTSPTPDNPQMPLPFLRETDGVYLRRTHQARTTLAVIRNKLIRCFLRFLNGGFNLDSFRSTLVMLRFAGVDDFRDSGTITAASANVNIPVC